LGNFDPEEVVAAGNLEPSNEAAEAEAEEGYEARFFEV